MRFVPRLFILPLVALAGWAAPATAAEKVQDVGVWGIFRTPDQKVCRIIGALGGTGIAIQYKATGDVATVWIVDGNWSGLKDRDTIPVVVDLGSASLTGSGTIIVVENHQMLSIELGGAPFFERLAKAPSLTVRTGDTDVIRGPLRDMPEAIKVVTSCAQALAAPAA